jgi:hypothetical protein
LDSGEQESICGVVSTHLYAFSGQFDFRRNLFPWSLDASVLIFFPYGLVQLNKYFRSSVEFIQIPLQKANIRNQSFTH